MHDSMYHSIYNLQAINSSRHSSGIHKDKPYYQAIKMQGPTVHRAGIVVLLLVLVLLVAVKSASIREYQSCLFFPLSKNNCCEDNAVASLVAKKQRM